MSVDTDDGKVVVGSGSEGDASGGPVCDDATYASIKQAWCECMTEMLQGSNAEKVKLMRRLWVTAYPTEGAVRNVALDKGHAFLVASSPFCQS